MVRKAKKRVECKLEEELVARIDWVAGLLKTNRTDIVRSACTAYLKNIEIGARANVKDATELIEAGYEYVCDMDNIKLFRKRK